MEALPAATVVLCRITKEWPHKILLQNRSSKAAFLPGAYVFPGGRLEDQDQEFSEYLSLDRDSFDRIAPYFAEISAAPYVACAIRETFEETGLSIVRCQKTNHMIASHELKNLLDGDDKTKIAPSLKTIWPISWWITPHGETRRFDTRFFLSLIDDNDACDQFEEPFADGIAEHRWFTPQEALAAYDHKEIFLAPPTRSIIERMAETKTLEDFLSHVDKPLIPIKPFFKDDQDKKYLILPGDRDHEEKIKPAMLMKTRYQFP